MLRAVRPAPREGGGPSLPPPDHGRVLHSSRQGFSAVWEAPGIRWRRNHTAAAPLAAEPPKNGGFSWGKRFFSLEVETNIPRQGRLGTDQCKGASGGRGVPGPSHSTPSLTWPHRRRTEDNREARPCRDSKRPLPSALLTPTPSSAGQPAGGDASPRLGRGKTATTTERCTAGQVPLARCHPVGHRTR